MPRIIVASLSTTFRAGIHTLLGGDPDFHFLPEIKGSDDRPDPGWDECIWIFSSSDIKWLLESFRERILGARGLLIIGNEDVVREVIQFEISAQHGWGVLPVQASTDALRYAVYAIDQGLTVLSPAAVQETSRLWEKERGRGELSDLHDALTERELDVLRLLSQGLANKQIAQKLQLSENTIKFHVSSIYSKLDVSNRTEALRKGAGLGLVAL